MKLYCAVIVVLFILQGCTEHNEVIQTPQRVSGEFSEQIMPIFRSECGGSSCHGGGPRGFAGGLDLTSYEGVMRGSRFGAVVVSGSPYMSHLVQSVNRTDSLISPISSVSMPASRSSLSEEQIGTIVNWIRSGARNDDGVLPFPEPRPLGKVFFTSQFVDLVGVIDIQSGLVTRYVSVGNPPPVAVPQAPHNVQVDDQGMFYYVTLISASKVKKYDARTHEFLGEVVVGPSPAHVVISADGGKAYVTSFTEGVGQVFVVNTSTMMVTRTITSPIMKATHGARLSHDGRYLYVGSNRSDMLTVIGTETDEIITHLHMSGSPSPGSFVYKPYQIAVRSDDRFIYVTCSGTSIDPTGLGAVSVFERNGDTFSFVTLVRVGANPLQCEITPDGRFLYVCNKNTGSVSVIRTDTNTLLTTIDNVGRQPHGIDITADSRTAYVTLENIASGDPPHHPLTGGKAPGFVAVIDVPSNTVIRRIEVGGFAAGVSITPGKGN